jgi:hypothetical protein
MLEGYVVHVALYANHVTPRLPQTSQHNKINQHPSKAIRCWRSARLKLYQQFVTSVCGTGPGSQVPLPPACRLEAFHPAVTQWAWLLSTTECQCASLARYEQAIRCFKVVVGCRTLQQECA